MVETDPLLRGAIGMARMLAHPSRAVSEKQAAMSTNASGTEERIDARTRRAAEESMTVVTAGEGKFEVWSGTNDEPYVVDIVTGECGCADYEFNLGADELCKHAQRTEMELGLRDIPELDHRTDVEVMRGVRVGSEEPADEPVMADGGSTCPHDHPECEGVESGRERPWLCFPCWREWS